MHAAEPVTLRYLGTAVNQSTDIAKKVKEDLGIIIEYVPVTTDVVAKRIITQPNSFDLVDANTFRCPIWCLPAISSAWMPRRSSSPTRSPRC